MSVIIEFDSTENQTVLEEAGETITAGRRYFFGYPETSAEPVFGNIARTKFHVQVSALLDVLP